MKNTKSQFNKLTHLLLVVALIGLISSCKKTTYEPPPPPPHFPISADVIVNWNSLVSRIDLDNDDFRPCPITSILAYTALANYETCVPGLADYKSIAGNYQGLVIPKFNFKLSDINWEIVLNVSTAYMYKHYFPQYYVMIDSLEATLLIKYEKNVDQNIITTSINWGQSVAEAVFNYSKTDLITFEGYLNPFPSYIIKSGSAYWEPTPPEFLKAKFPQWGKARTFAITEYDKFVPEPLAFSTDTNSQYYMQALEIYTRSVIGNDYDSWIADFWSDDIANITFSPAMRWLVIANQVYESSICNLEKALVTNTKICLALNDATVACWDQKYKYQVERPVTYIRKYIDPDYKTGLTTIGLTPNSPSYPSFHGTIAGSVAEVLTHEFGEDFEMTDRCHEGNINFNGTPRSFPNFYAMAEECALSRIPLGVNFRMDETSAVTLGYSIGRKVNKLPFIK
ncbi:MAG TPA: vanadium-dependent haloperoxidase [Saprospiraceae bacterium]|nr:vanadium-dependent haloperoxidase [Saprospiraceae bacterium]